MSGDKESLKLDEIDFAPDEYSPRILVVEDDPALKKLIEKMITIKKCGVPRFSATGGDALEIIKNEKIDIVFLDIQLPDMSGFEVAAEIRRLETCRGTYRERRLPIIALSGFSGPGIEERCFESGIDEYLYKPLSVADMVDRVRTYSII